METEVLIVGGGLSGLAFADQLARQGVDFLLTEAQERFGGRILTKEVAGGRFDLGPAWFWPGQPRMAAMARRFKIPVFEQYAMGDLMYQDHSGAVQRGRGYASMQGSYRLAGGMSALIESLLSTLDKSKILNNTRLKKITHNTDGIIAEFDQGGLTTTIKARQIVLALPPRVIADTIAFDPALDAAQIQALKNVPTWMAGQAKIVAVYDDPHWRNVGLSGDAMSQRGPMMEIHDASPMKGGPYALFGFVGVPPAAREEHRDTLDKMAVSQLIDLFGAKMADPIALIVQDWATVGEVARAQDQRPIRMHPSYGLPYSLRELENKGIVFTSTETANGFGGFLEGALEAAENTALKIQNEAQPKSQVVKARYSLK